MNAKNTQQHFKTEKCQILTAYHGKVVKLKSAYKRVWKSQVNKDFGKQIQNRKDGLGK